MVVMVRVVVSPVSDVKTIPGIVYTSYFLETSSMRVYFLTHFFGGASRGEGVVAGSKVLWSHVTINISDFQ